MNPLDPRPIETFLDPRHLDLAIAAAAFATRELHARPPAVDDAAARREARELATLMGEAGALRVAVPARFGGLDAVPGVRAAAP